MEFLGELERAFATSLYPLRVPIGIGLLVGLVGLVLFARRRGWFAAARRHPGRETALAIALLAVGLPVGWYLGSPLFIRTALVEPAPPAAPSAGPSAAIPSATMATPGPTEAASPAPIVTTPPLAPVLSGEFTGADDFHFGSGTARLIETEPGVWIVRFEDFSVRNGPDLYVYLSPDADGYADGAVELGRLRATDGAFNTTVPPGTDVTDLRSVVIWCKQFAVQFAIAPLS